MDLKSLASARTTYSLFEEFKAFAFKGNVIDLAVGVIIGAAFGKIVSSLVENLLMPLVGVITPGGKGYEGWRLVIDGKVIPYGKFLGDVVNFLIVAAVLFLFIKKFIGWMMASRQQESQEVPSLTKEQELLTEIRDLLKQKAPAPDAPAS